MSGPPVFQSLHSTFLNINAMHLKQFTPWIVPGITQSLGLTLLIGKLQTLTHRHIPAPQEYQSLLGYSLISEKMTLQNAEIRQKWRKI